MVLNIINKDGSKIPTETHVSLWWMASLVGESIMVSGEMSFLAYMYLNWEKTEDRVKYSWTITVMEKSPNVTDFYLEEYKRLYKTVKEGRKIKHKDRNLLIVAQKAEKVLKSLFDETKSLIKNVAVQNKFYELYTITDFDRDNRKNPILIYSIFVLPSNEQKEKIIWSVSNLIRQPDCVSLVDDSIKKLFQGSEINNAEDAAATPEFIYEFLFEIVAPETLNSSQLITIRNEFSKVFWHYFDELEKVNEEMKGIAFMKDNLKMLIDLYQSKTVELKPGLQKVIDENEILNKLKTENGITERYKMFIGITSFDNLLTYYNKMEVLNDDIVLYVKEEIGKTVSTKNGKMFMFLEK